MTTGTQQKSQRDIAFWLDFGRMEANVKECLRRLDVQDAKFRALESKQQSMLQQVRRQDAWSNQQNAGFDERDVNPQRDEARFVSLELNQQAILQRLDSQDAKFATLEANQKAILQMLANLTSAPAN